MNIETCVTLSSLLKQKNIFFSFSDPFYWRFFNPHRSTQTTKVIGLIFDSNSWSWQFGQWAMHMHFNNIIIL